MDKRFQVFISSTYVDLKEERRAIIESLLNARYIPSGMEIFSASSDEQFEYIKKIIDDCDYYILILKNNYGSVSKKTGISYTEMEYDYAVEKNIPILAFIYSSIENKKIDLIEKENRSSFWRFREKVLGTNRLCKLWDSSLELIPSVISSLNEEVKRNPQIGWIRPDVWEEYYLVSAINKLRNKKSSLEKDVEILNRQRLNQLDLDRVATVLTIHGIRYDNIRCIEGRGSVLIDIEELFEKIGNDLECIKRTVELKNSILNHINLICGSCFTLIDHDDMDNILNTLCNMEFIRRIIDHNEEYIGLSVKGKKYLDYLIGE